MHHLNLLRLSLLQCALINLAYTANKSLSTKSTTPSKPAWNQDTPIENVPGALAVGKEPYLNHEDPNIDLVEITKQLIKLLDKIKDALDDTITSTLRAVGTAPATTITSTISAVQNPALRPKGAAYGCGQRGRDLRLLLELHHQFRRSPRRDAGRMSLQRVFQRRLER
ncbi:MAG: hypothetical protein Q9203_007011 [Teloschistes exilis]